MDKKSGFVFDGLSIAGYIDVSRRDTVDQLRELGVTTEPADVERRRIAIPFDQIGPYYQGQSIDGEPIVVVYSCGNDWHLWGDFDDFASVYAGARLALL